MNRKIVLTAITITCGVGLVSFYAWEHWPRATDVQVLGKPSLMPEIMSAGKVVQATEAPPSEPRKPMEDLGIVTPKPLTKQQQYDKLKNGTASERMQAYQIVKSCLEPEAIFEGNRQLGIDVPRPDSVKNCDDLNPGIQQNDEERRALLIPAVKAGAKGAFAALMQMEGPGGFMERMGRPPIAQAEFDVLMAEAKESGKATADPDTMEVHIARVLNNPNATQDDRAHAIEYAVAAYVRRYDGQPPRPVSEFVQESPRVQALIKTLPPEVAQQAIAAGTVPRPKEFRK